MKQEENLDNLVRGSKTNKQKKMFQQSMSSAAGPLNEIENSLNENREFFIQYDKVLFGDLRP